MRMKKHPNTNSQYRELCMVNQVTCNNSQILEIFIYVSVLFLLVSFSQHKFFVTAGAGFLEKCAAFINDFSCRVLKEIRSNKFGEETTLEDPEFDSPYRLKILFSAKCSKLAQILVINRHRRYFRGVNAAGA